MRIKTANIIRNMVPAPPGAVVVWYGKDDETTPFYCRTTPCLAIVHFAEHIVIDRGDRDILVGKRIVGQEFAPLTYCSGNQWYEADESVGEQIMTPQTTMAEIVLRLEQQSYDINEALPVILSALRKVGIVPQ